MMMKVMDDIWDDEWIMKGEWTCWWVDERMQWCEDEYSYKVRLLKKCEGKLKIWLWKLKIIKVDENDKEVDFWKIWNTLKKRGKINKSCCEILSCTNIYTKK